jgi:hypothetical protein
MHKEHHADTGELCEVVAFINSGDWYRNCRLIGTGRGGTSFHRYYDRSAQGHAALTAGPIGALGPVTEIEIRIESM